MNWGNSFLFGKATFYGRAGWQTRERVILCCVLFPLANTPVVFTAISKFSGSSSGNKYKGLSFANTHSIIFSMLYSQELWEALLTFIVCYAKINLKQKSTPSIVIQKYQKTEAHKSKYSQDIHMYTMVLISYSNTDKI